jgi:hypothetical protein
LGADVLENRAFLMVQEPFCDERQEAVMLGMDKET